MEKCRELKHTFYWDVVYVDPRNYNRADDDDACVAAHLAVLTLLRRSLNIFFDLWKVFFLKEKRLQHTICCHEMLLSGLDGILHPFNLLSSQKYMYIWIRAGFVWETSTNSPPFSLFFCYFFRLITDKRGIISLLKKFLSIFVMFDYISFENFLPGDQPTYMSACDGWYGGKKTKDETTQRIRSWRLIWQLEMKLWLKRDSWWAPAQNLILSFTYNIDS